jgi:hypothetical protein
MELFVFLCWWHRERQSRAVQDEEARDDALGGYRTTVIAGLLRTLTIQLEGTTGAQGQSVQNCTLFKTTARSIGVPRYQVRGRLGRPCRESGGCQQ